MKVKRKEIKQNLVALEFDGSKSSFLQIKPYLEAIFESVRYDEKAKTIDCVWFCEYCEYEKGEWLIFDLNDNNKYPDSFASKEDMQKVYDIQ